MSKKRIEMLIDVNRARAAAKGTVGGCGGQRRPWGCFGGVRGGWGGLISALVPAKTAVLSIAGTGSQPLQVLDPFSITKARTGTPGVVLDLKKRLLDKKAPYG